MPEKPPEVRATTDSKPVVDEDSVESAAPIEDGIGAPSQASGMTAAPSRRGIPLRAVAVRVRHAPDYIVANIRPGPGAIVSAAVAALVLAGAVALGPVDGLNSLLVGLGFDPDRAQLITALIVGGTAAFVAFLSGGAGRTSVAVGFAATVGLFGPTFVRETQDAMAATGAIGAFDPIGWTQTLLTFVVFGLLTAWACVTCAAPVRSALAASARAAAVAMRQRPSRKHWTRPVGALLAIALLALTVPVALDLFNYGVEDRMISGGPPRQGLVPNDQGLPSVSASLPNAPTGAPSETPSVSPSGSATTVPTPAANASPTALQPPWKSAPPSGQGQMVYLALSAPWVKAGTATEEVDIYLPPGYAASKTKRYPTVYEAPFTFNLWNSAFHVKATLDALIDGGEIPPSLFVFMNEWGGPFADPQCSDSYDGREKVDQFMGVTVPAYVDKHYRTIARPEARSLIGMSEGGYCAAILALHHPDVFGSEMSFSGYFTAGLGSAGAAVVYGGNQTLIYQDSPKYVAPGLAQSVRSSLYVVLVAQPSQALYGPEATGYAAILDGAGIKYTFVEAKEPHGWPQVRDYFGQALTLVGLREAELGVFT